MPSGHDQPGGQLASSSRRRSELLTFVILAVFVWPFLTVAFVGGYGFIVWISQMIFGPPGPPG